MQVYQIIAQNWYFSTREIKIIDSTEKIVQIITSKKISYFIFRKHNWEFTTNVFKQEKT